LFDELLGFIGKQDAILPEGLVIALIARIVHDCNCLVQLFFLFEVEFDV